MTAESVHFTKNALSAEAITRAFFENYESIYDIDLETSVYQCYHESTPYSTLNIESSGADFFASCFSHIPQVIHAEDREYVEKMLSRPALLAALEKEKYYSFVYRLMLGDRPVYHKARATLAQVDGRTHILLGIRNVDETIRQEKAHTEALASMYQKEKNHMAAILGSAAGYMEINLTQDIVLDCVPHLFAACCDITGLRPDFGEPTRYSVLNEWLRAHLILVNRQRCARISDREYLMACFTRGEKLASVSFSVRKRDGSALPCKAVFYLYQDDVSGDIMAFCVIYDLTEQQRRDKEMRELENALEMSRIRNSTSQMQPHFLYNALGSIQEVLLEDPEYASRLIGDFTVHLRSCIRVMTNDAPIPFPQELANIRAYTNIERMRFGDKLKIRYEIATDRFSILPLSIQPLVENAIRHGIYQRGPAGGTVVLRSRETAEDWIVEVEDDGVGFDVAATAAAAAAGTRDSTGLQNLQFRLNKVMHASVDIHSQVGVGTKVTVTIPKGGETE